MGQDTVYRYSEELYKAGLVTRDKIKGKRGNVYKFSQRTDSSFLRTRLSDGNSYPITITSATMNEAMSVLNSKSDKISEKVYINLSFSPYSPIVINYESIDKSHSLIDVFLRLQKKYSIRIDKSLVDIKEEEIDRNRETQIKISSEKEDSIDIEEKNIIDISTEKDTNIEFDPVKAKIDITEKRELRQVYSMMFVTQSNNSDMMSFDQIHNYLGYSIDRIKDEAKVLIQYEPKRFFLSHDGFTMHRS